MYKFMGFGEASGWDLVPREIFEFLEGRPGSPKQKKISNNLEILKNVNFRKTKKSHDLANHSSMHTTLLKNPNHQTVYKHTLN